PSGGAPRWLWAVGALVLVLAFACGLRSCWTREGSVQLARVYWDREIEVEQLQLTSDGSWEESVPAKARDLRCYEKKKDTRKIPDGEDCHTVKVDQGDGSFKEKQECKPRYRTEDVMGRWCDYQVEKWKIVRTARAEGDDHDPKWPSAPVDNCPLLNCTREGDRRARHLVDVTVGGGEPQACEIAVDLWKGAEVGQTWTAAVRVLGGGVDCGSLHP
ncbi:MAG TPA: hypothetical protein PKA64_27000, partial [Myxococcota bacterium]|nr:hypothetical protein [Myxococcota bacterium]